jgi:hypothetical protein
MQAVFESIYLHSNTKIDFFFFDYLLELKKRSYIYIFYIQRRHWRNSASVDSGIHKIAINAGQDTHNMHVTFSGIYDRIDDGLDYIKKSTKGSKSRKKKEMMAK